MSSSTESGELRSSVFVGWFGGPLVAVLAVAIAAASPIVGQLLPVLAAAGDDASKEPEAERCSSVGEEPPPLALRVGLRSCANWQREPYAHVPVCDHIPQIMRCSAWFRWRASREMG